MEKSLETINLDTIVSNGYCFQIEMKFRNVLAGLNIVEIPQDQNFKMSQILRKTIQQQGAKPDTLKAFEKLAELVK